MHWYKEKSPHWQTSAVVNGLGAVATFIVLMIITVTKFHDGAWLIVIAIPLLIAMFISIIKHYQYVAERLHISDFIPCGYISRIQTDTVTHPAIVIVGQLNRGTVEALDYARSIADEVVAIHVDIGGTNRVLLRQQWDKFESDIQLSILDSPYRSIVQPIVQFITEYEVAHPAILSTVIIPSLVTRHWWEQLLYNQTTLFIKTALLNKKSRIVTSVRYYLYKIFQS